MTEEILKWLMGGGGVIALGKLALDYRKSKEPVNAAHDAHTHLIKNLQDERDEWKAHAAERERERDEMKDLISLLRSQNQMLRLLLIQKGVTESELIAIGVVS